MSLSKESPSSPDDGPGSKQPAKEPTKAKMTIAENTPTSTACPTQQVQISSLVTLMNSRQEMVEMQAHGCAILAALAKESKDNKYTIARVGGIDTVIRAMQNYVKDADVAAFGCDALACLAFRHGENQVAIAKAEGIPCILGAMQLHIGNANVQTNGCGALLNLAANVENKKLITQAFGISVVETAMRHHKSVEQMQEYGHAAITFLSA